MHHHRQAKAFEDLGPVLLNYRAEPFDATAAFGRNAPLILEIGFGMGEATAHIARVRPADNFLCCEVHEPGVGALLKRIGEQDITNIASSSTTPWGHRPHAGPRQPGRHPHFFFFLSRPLAQEKSTTSAA